MRKRFLAVIVLVPLVPYLVGCHKRVSLDPSEMKAAPRERIVELTTTDGQVITFEPWAFVRGDRVVYGTGRSTVPYEIPASQVTRRVENERNGRIASVSTADGRQIRFEPPGATVR